MLLQRPAAAIVLCLDRDVLEAEGVSPTDPTPGYDIGTDAANDAALPPMRSASAAGRSAPARAAVAEVLQPPAGLEPRMIVCLGHAPPSQQMPMRATKVTWRDPDALGRFKATEEPPVGSRLELRLGIDVGGTNTDAVVLDREDRLLARAKVPTTPDVSSGIAAAAAAAVADLGTDRGRITHAMLGTTHATNAVLERRHLRRVAVIRSGPRDACDPAAVRGPRT